MLCGGIIAIIIENKGDLKTAIYKSRFVIVSIILSALSYKIVFDILKKLDIIQNSYNNQLTPLAKMPEHILLAIKLGFGNLVNYNVAFMPLSMTILFALFLVAFLVFLWQANLNKSTKFSIMILLCGAIVASQMHIMISNYIIFAPRVEYYGLMFLRVLIVALAFKFCVDFIRAQKIAQNLLFILSTILIWVCIVQDLYAQRVQKLAFDAEIKLLNRVIARIEQNENFSYKNKYCSIRFGDTPNFSERFYSGKRKNNADLIERVLLGYMKSFNFLMLSKVFDGCNFHAGDYNPDTIRIHKIKEQKIQQFNSLISRLHKAGILDTLEPYPHKNSVVVFGDIIVFVASKGNLDEIHAMAKDMQNNDK
ncbi:hypothetical protein [Helicobacter sp. T3_23-1059]